MTVSEHEKWPNFFIVGAVRAGTTSLYHSLKAHPSIYLSPVKEPGYFIPPHKAQMRLVPEKTEYLRLFEGVRDEIAYGEATTHYLGEPTSPGQIHAIIPNAKIIISLRDPVERAFSNWFAKVHRWNQRAPPFSQAVQESPGQEDRNKMPMYISLGFYSDQVQRYWDIFGKSQVKIIIFEEFVRDIKSTFNDIIKFLGIEPSDSELSEEAYNASGGKLPKRRVLASKRLKKVSALVPSRIRRALKPRVYKELRKPVMDPADRLVLEDLYRADVKRLSTMLSRPLPWAWASLDQDSSAE